MEGIGGAQESSGEAWTRARPVGGRDVDTLKTYCRGRNDEALQSNKLARLHKLQSTVRALSATVGSLSPLS